MEVDFVGTCGADVSKTIYENELCFRCEYGRIKSCVIVKSKEDFCRLCSMVQREAGGSFDR